MQLATSVIDRHPRLERVSRRRFGAAALAGLCAAASLALTPAPAGAMVSDTPVPTVQFGDGEVRATAQIGNRLYVGGSFRRVGPLRTGSAGVADAVTGSFAGTPFPSIDGIVNVAVSDGTGGWYVGGDFDAVGGFYRQNIARVLADGTVTAFKPKTDGPVYALARSADAGALYVGGAFATVSTQPFANLAKVDPLTGAPVAWSGTADGTVRHLSLEGARLVVGGAFSSIGGTSRQRLAILDATTGAVDPAFNPGIVNGEVRAVVRSLDGSTLYVGGAFTSFGGSTRNRVAAVATANGALSTFNPNADNAVHALALSPSGTTLYLGGAFQSVTGTSRRNLAGVTIPTGALTPLGFYMQSGPVDALAAGPDGTTLYVGGTFDLRVTTPPNPVRVMAVNVTTNAYLPFNPALFEPAVGRVGVRALTLDGSRIFVGGDFGAYDGVERPYLVAIDLTTGQIDPAFNPLPDKPVYALAPAPDGSALYAGGLFTKLNGRFVERLAKLDPTTGAAATGFTPRPNAEVSKLVVHGSTVYAAGKFTVVGGQTRTYLAGVSTTNGAVGPLNLSINASLRSLDVTGNGATLFITGGFSSVGGQARYGVAAIGTASGSVTPWAPLTYQYARYMRDIELSPDDSALYVVTSGGDNPPAGDTAIKFPTAGSGNVAPLWVNRVKDTIEAVAADDDAVYIGGHFRWVDNGAKTRTKIAALDPATGLGLDWNPTANGFRGVLDLTIGTSGLLVGSDGTHVGQEPSARFALLPFVEGP